MRKCSWDKMFTFERCSTWFFFYKSISGLEQESIESLHIDSSDESLAPAVSLPVVVALSNSVSAGDVANGWPLGVVFSFALIRPSALAFGGWVWHCRMIAKRCCVISRSVSEQNCGHTVWTVILMPKNYYLRCFLHLIRLFWNHTFT